MRGVTRSDSGRHKTGAHKSFSLPPKREKIAASYMIDCVGTPAAELVQVGESTRKDTSLPAFQTKPECIRKQTSSENVIVPSPIGTPSSEGAALASGVPPPGPAQSRDELCVSMGFRQMLVEAEMALALVLLLGAGLLIKSFTRLRSVDPGFNPEHVVSIFIQLPATRYVEIPKQTVFRRELLARLNSLPGIQAAMAGDVPLNGGEVTHSLAFEGRPEVSAGDEPEVDTFCVMGDYFRVMQIPLRAGRTLTAIDREGQPLTAVINEALAHQYFPYQNPIGQRIRWGRDTGPPRWMTIVGVVGDVKQYSFSQPAYPAVFTPFAQSDEAWRRWMSVVVRMPDSSGTLIPAVKRQIWSLDSQIPLNQIKSMDELLDLSFAERRFNMFLLALFAGLAIILAAVGTYGVMSYSVTQRTHEIGIRMAVGARSSDVLGLVMKQGAHLAAVGLAAGILGAFALTRLMIGLLFGVTPIDPATFAAVALLMMAVVFVACFVPARRGMRMDSMAALRYE